MFTRIVMRNFWRLRLTLVLWLSILAAPLIAQDAQLYDAPPPDDAAYVRFIGFPDEAEIALYGHLFSADRLVSGSYNILHGDATAGVQSGQIVSAVPDANGMPLVLIEPERTSRKVLLRLINLMPETDVSLTTEDGGVEIIGAVAPFDLGARDVNPIQISVALNMNGAMLGDPFPLVLRPKEHVTFVVMPNGETSLIVDSSIPEPVE